MVNLALHTATALMTGLLARRLGGVAWIAAVFVLLHPHANELLGMVAARTDALAALGILGALLLGPGWVADDQRVDRPTLRAATAAACVTFACLAKEVGFIAPALWVLVDLYRERRDPRPWLTPVLGAAAAATIRVVVLGSPVGAKEAPMALNIVGGLGSTGWALVDSLVPIPTAPWPPQHPPALGIAVLVAALALPLLKRWWGALFAVLWVIVAWAPMADWAHLGVRSSRALLYVPVLGVAIGLSRLPMWHAQPRRAAAVAVAVALLMAGLQGWSVSRWGSEEVLWQASAHANPESPTPWLNLGRARVGSNNLDGAEQAYRQAAALAQRAHDGTSFMPAATALGTIAMNAGRLDEARVYFEDAIQVVGPVGAPDAVRMLGELGLRSPR